METEMAGSELPEAKQDECAVTAVRLGDAERYRELVERHERRVFAVAWSRLGDAALAEEATQEAFIRGYRRLWLLGDGAKFSGWISTIARRVAINFGLSRRRELNTRERWALENPEPSSAENPSDETNPLHTLDTLRQTLAELPDAHRECLVLFYLEGKSGADVAATLGISEGALRVRLHRARAAMRERLEGKLESSLARLRPSKTLVPAIMAGVLASSSAKAATAGGAGAAAGLLAKFGLSKWLLPVASFFSSAFFLPMLVMTWLRSRMELKNFRDQKGFRARLHQAGMNRRILGVCVLFFAAWVIISRIPIDRVHTFSGLTVRPFFLGGAVWILSFLPFAARRLTINRSPYHLAQLGGSVVTGIWFLLAGLSVVPVAAVVTCIVGYCLLTVLWVRQRPIRMDYNLFLRAAEGLLKGATAARTHQRSARLGRSELLAFARFLGSRWLVTNHRWVESGLQLRLPVTGCSRWWDGILNWSWQSRSRIHLAWDGSVSAKLCETDQAELATFRDRAAISTSFQEALVAFSVGEAWRHFRESNTATAELALGQQTEQEVFVLSPAKVGFTIVPSMTAILVVLGIFVAFFTVLGLVAFLLRTPGGVR